MRTSGAALTLRVREILQGSGVGSVGQAGVDRELDFLRMRLDVPARAEENHEIMRSRSRRMRLDPWPEDDHDSGDDDFAPSPPVQPAVDVLIATIP